MRLDPAISLEVLVSELRAGIGLELKRRIAPAARAFGTTTQTTGLEPSCAGAWAIRNGDDAAAIPDGDGFLLLAAEGMLPAFVRDDPWFAGFCSVLVNVSDITAMGGHPIAVVDVWWDGGDVNAEALFSGMRAASEVFGVPIVGGHTGRSPHGSALAVAIVGRARRVITSFDAAPGDALVVAIDLRGELRGTANFDAATRADPAALRRQQRTLPELAETELVHAGKDISMAGLVGTVVMLCETSGCAATLDLDAVPRPPELPLPVWLKAFPSFGFVLAVRPEHVDAVVAVLHEAGVAAACCGGFEAGTAITLQHADERALFWDLRQPLTGFAPFRDDEDPCP